MEGSLLPLGRSPLWGAQSEPPADPEFGKKNMISPVRDQHLAWIWCNCGIFWATEIEKLYLHQILQTTRPGSQPSGLINRWLGILRGSIFRWWLTSLSLMNWTVKTSFSFMVFNYLLVFHRINRAGNGRRLHACHAGLLVLNSGGWKTPTPSSIGITF